MQGPKGIPYRRAVIATDLVDVREMLSRRERVERVDEQSSGWRCFENLDC